MLDVSLTQQKAGTTPSDGSLSDNPVLILSPGMKAYSYLRFSRTEQSVGDSLRRQSTMAENWCRANGVKLDKELYFDKGVSAFKGANRETGALARFLSAIESGKIARGSILLVESFDRLSRENIQKALRLFMQIMENGVDVVTLSDGRRYNSAKLDLTDLIIFLSVASRANEESETKARRLRSLWVERRKAAAESKTPLPGNVPKWIIRNGNKLSLNKPVAALVRLVFDMAAEGKGPRIILAALRGRPHNQWNYPVSVRGLLASRTVVGDLVIYDSNRKPIDVVKNFYPPVVTRQVFATVNTRMAAQRTPGRRIRTSGNVFSGLAVDAPTGTAIHRITGNGHRYLVSAAHIDGKAKRHGWNYNQFLESFLALTHKASLAKPVRHRNGNDELAGLKMELADAEKQAERLVDYLAQGNESAAVKKRLGETEKSVRTLRSKIEHAESEAHANPVAVDQVDWEDSAALRENLVATVKRITIDAAKRTFTAEFLDGRVYEYKEEGDKVTIKVPAGS